MGDVQENVPAATRKVLGELNRGGSGLPAPGWSSFKKNRSTRSDKPTTTTTVTERTNQEEEEDDHDDDNFDDVAVCLPQTTIEELSEKHFGMEEERESKQAELLKRTKPEQRLFGYPKKYVENETKRLATGIREYLSSRDKFVDACKDYERTVLSSLESAKVKMETLRKAERIATRKAKQQETSLRELKKLEASLNETLAKVRADLQTQKGKESLFAQTKSDLESKVSTLEKQIDTLKGQLEDQQQLVSQLTSKVSFAEERESTLRKELEGVDAQKQAALQELEQVHAQKESQWKVQLETSEAKSREWEQKTEELREKISTLREEMKSTEERTRKIEDENTRLKLSEENLRSQLQSMEQQAKQRDLHLDKTLETFQQNQSFSQERIALLSEEKAKLEVRVTDLSNLKGQLEVENTKLTASLKEATDANANLTSTLAEKSQLLDGTKEELNNLKIESVQAISNLEKTNREKAALSVALDKVKAEKDQEREKAEKVTKEMQTEIERLNSENAELKKRSSDLESEVEALKSTYGQASLSNDAQLERLCEVSKEAEMLKRQVNNLDRYQGQVAELQAALKLAEERLFESDKARRRLHNEVQALKGKIRVVARVRPLGTTRKSDGDEESNKVLPDHIQCSIDGTELSVETEQEQTNGTAIKKHQFTFDRVFPPVTNQEEVFEEVSSFVQSALDGYNVCLFSYGQTGSGKTFTMTGDHSCPKKRGIIPRSIDQIMSYRMELRSKGWEYELEAQYLEIYNETIQDLLQGNAGTKLEIRDSKKEIIVTNAKRIPINDRDDIHKVLSLAEKNRSVAATDMNLHSSRSHSIFTLFIKGEHKEFGAQVIGSLSMCDLAGSERISKSNATGDRLKEAQAINKSLSSLANVFASLHKKTAHVPYRNSKLTHLLQPCFAGEGKTMMIVNLSPEQDDKAESLCSLRFAGQVNSTELGKAKRQISAKQQQ